MVKGFCIYAKTRRFKERLANLFLIIRVWELEGLILTLLFSASKKEEEEEKKNWEDDFDENNLSC